MTNILFNALGLFRSFVDRYPPRCVPLDSTAVVCMWRFPVLKSGCSKLFLNAGHLKSSWVCEYLGRWTFQYSNLFRLCSLFLATIRVFFFYPCFQCRHFACKVCFRPLTGLKICLNTRNNFTYANKLWWIHFCTPLLRCAIISEWYVHVSIIAKGWKQNQAGRFHRNLLQG